jgi:hypothetical protein
LAEVLERDAGDQVERFRQVVAMLRAEGGRIDGVDGRPRGGGLALADDLDGTEPESRVVRRVLRVGWPRCDQQRTTQRGVFV